MGYLSGMAPRRSTAATRRAQIRAVAAREFGLHGLHGTSVEVIAAKAGISEAYVFRLFRSKVALFVEVVVAAFARTTEGMLAAAGDLRGPEALMVMGETYKALLRDRTTLLLQQQGFAACANAQVRRAVCGAFGRLWGEVARVSGLAPLKVKTFIAYGMLLNDLASMDVDRIDQPWVRDSRTPVPIETFR